MHKASSRNVAETEGFEPSIRVNVYTLSRRAPSTTRPRLHRKVFLTVELAISGLETQELNDGIYFAGEFPDNGEAVFFQAAD
jgi:hypothetical protein